MKHTSTESEPFEETARQFIDQYKQFRELGREPMRYPSTFRNLLMQLGYFHALVCAPIHMLAYFVLFTGRMVHFPPAMENRLTNIIPAVIVFDVVYVGLLLMTLLVGSVVLGLTAARKK